VDGGPANGVDELEQNSQHDWEAGGERWGAARDGAADGLRSLEPNTLEVWAVDPGVVLERIVVSHGPLLPSYLGPPESVR